MEALGRLTPRSGWSSWSTHLALLLAISVAAGLAISPGLYGQQVPQLKVHDIGKPFAASSPSGFKAGRDYEIPNQGLTEQRRQEARVAVRPVYDFNPAVLAELRLTLHEAFAGMQEALAQADRELVAVVAPETHGAKRKRLQPASPALKDALPVLKGRGVLEQRLFPLTDEDFQSLLTARFSREVEAATLALLERAYGAPVATSRDELMQVGSQGLSVRDLGEDREHLSPGAFPALQDVREARDEMDRYASVPGNLLPDAPAALKGAMLRLAKRMVRPNLTVNIAETEGRRVKAAHEVKDAVVFVKRGQKILGDGELITADHLLLLGGMRARRDKLDVFQLQLGAVGLVLLLIAGTYGFHRAAFRRFRPTRKDAVLLGLWLTLLLSSLHLGVMVADALHDRFGRIPLAAFYDALPICAGAMLVRFILTEELALFFTIVASSLAGVMLGNSLSFAIYALVSSLVAADRIARAKERSGIFRAGLFTGGVNFLLILVLGMAEGKGVSLAGLVAASFGLLGTALVAPMVVLALTPLVEIGFGYASDVKLLELANLNHPALKELIVQSPGTYHHSIIVGSLVEGAAEVIGANSLLARCCAYYHDIGKGKNPLFFGENQKGENRHDRLAPGMSAVIIKRHVTEGMELARQYKLPKVVTDVISQHHGTRLVGYFYHKACKEAESKPDAAGVDESVYRYSGPRPQFREAALVMIADAVEAASRSMPEPTTVKLQALVQKIINGVFSEGQLDECDLTLRDLNRIAQSFLHTLEGIYHTRPAYPSGAVGEARPGLIDLSKPPAASLTPGRQDTSKRTVKHS